MDPNSPEAILANAFANWLRSRFAESPYQQQWRLVRLAQNQGYDFWMLYDSPPVQELKIRSVQ